MKRRWLYVGGALLGVLLVSAFLLPIRTTPEAACRVSMAWAVGYGPWRLQRVWIMAPDAQLTYSDGYTKSACVVRALGSLWYVAPIVSETGVGCSLGVKEGPCPRRWYGVVP